jgi:phosphohistidine phosphatase
MILYLVRHGIAVDRTDPKCPPEAERPLTARGVQKTRSAALGLRALGAKPDVLITSPFVRAAQTAEIFAEALGFPLDKIRVNESLKPAGNPADIVREISHLRAKEVAVFGHAPHLDLTIAHLAGARTPFTELKKAGAACFEHVSSHGGWELRWILTPKVLRDLGD